LNHSLGTHTPQAFRSLLVPIDLSPLSDRVAERAALLPLGESARITLLHVVPETLPRIDRRRAMADAKRVLGAEVEGLARTLPRSVAIQPLVKAGAVAPSIAGCARAVKADLIVMGRGDGRALRDVFLGSTSERVIRQAQLPVLAVRLRARAPYRRPALALDFDDTAPEAIAMLLRLIPRSRARVEIIHAYHDPYSARSYSGLSEEDAEEYRDHQRRKALREITRLLGAALLRAKVPRDDTPSWRTHVHHGAPRTLIEKTVRKANTDLLVLGTHGYSGMAHVLLGTVAGDVLRGVACDVLVVPPRAKPARTRSRKERSPSPR
jgi:nucleotide-binding universal stress UspA family protein